MISATGLTRVYRDGEKKISVLDDAHFEIGAGEFVAIVGRSGCGKSTLLHLLGGLDADFGGELVVGGIALARLKEPALAQYRNTTVGLVFQSFHLIQGLSALDNVMLPAAFATEERASTHAALDVLSQVGLSDKAHRMPAQLSGGERQRVAVARALVHRPAVLLCDEPTGNLDAQTADEVVSLLKRLHGTGLTVVAVTHEDRLRAAATRVLTVAGGKVS